MNPSPARQLDRLRSWRVPVARDLTLAGPLGDQARELKRQARTFGSLGAAWQELAPQGPGERASLVSLSRGVLTVRCEDAATRFELDRWLRAGGEIALIKRAAAKLTRVRLVL